MTRPLAVIALGVLLGWSLAQLPREFLTHVILAVAR